MKKWVWITSGLLVFALCGCLKLDQEITLNKDGSGRGKIMYAMSEQTIQQMKAMAEIAKQQMPGEEGQKAAEEDQFEFDEAKIKERFKALKDKGITLKSVKTETKDGWQYTYIDFAFKDISKLKEMESFKEDSFTITKNAEGNYVITMKMGGGEMGPAEAGAEQMKAMLPMFKGMRISMKFNTPGTIIETNAPIKGKKSAGLVIDVDKDPDSLFQMSKLGDIKIVFDGKGCTIPEVR